MKEKIWKVSQNTVFFVLFDDKECLSSFFLVGEVYIKLNSSIPSPKKLKRQKEVMSVFGRDGFGWLRKVRKSWNSFD